MKTRFYLMEVYAVFEFTYIWRYIIIFISTSTRFATDCWTPGAFGPAFILPKAPEAPLWKPLANLKLFSIPKINLQPKIVKETQWLTYMTAFWTLITASESAKVSMSNPSKSPSYSSPPSSSTTYSPSSSSKSANTDANGDPNMPLRCCSVTGASSLLSATIWFSSLSPLPSNVAP